MQEMHNIKQNCYQRFEGTC